VFQRPFLSPPSEANVISDTAAYCIYTQSLLSAVTPWTPGGTSGEVRSPLVSCPNNCLLHPVFLHSFVGVTAKSRFRENKNKSRFCEDKNKSRF
jgi:hypothetical protein